MRGVALGLCALLCVLTAGCAGSGASHDAASAGSTAPTPGGSASLLGPPAQLVSATLGDNGRTLQLGVGDALRVSLASTYWVFATRGIDVLQGSRPRAVPAPVGEHHVPGSGAGTVTETFRAVHPGQAVVTATRTSCGEAMRCTAQQATFRLVVDVH